LIYDYGKTLARYQFLMNRWAMGWVNLPQVDEAATRTQINSWLSDFERTMKSGQININMAATMTGLGNTGIPDAETLFAEVYKGQAVALSSVDVTEARLLRNEMARTFGASWKEMYTAWDEYIAESSALGMTLEEQVQAFMDKPIFRESINIVDRAGRVWLPQNYATMYARTRGREIENEMAVRQMNDFGIDVVQISITPTKTPICKKYVGKYFSLTGATEGLPVLPFKPPFHPNCVHHVLSASRIPVETAIASNAMRTFSATVKEMATIAKQESWLNTNRPNTLAAA
jgi:hypothetical protein